MQEVPLIQKFDEQPHQAIEFTQNWEPDRFVFDFKNLTPQFGPNGAPQTMLTHRVVMMDPWLAKQFHEHLGNAVADYEKRFGPIEESDARKKARSEKVEMGTARSEKPSYYG